MPLHFMPARGAASTARTAPSLTVLCDLQQFRPQPLSHAETRDRTGDRQIFSLTLSQLSYRGCWLWVHAPGRHKRCMRQHQWAHGALAGCLCPKWQMRSAAGQAALDTLAPRRHRPRASCARTAGRAHHASEAQFCRDPGSSRGPSDLQSDALPTELSRLLVVCTCSWMLEALRAPASVGAWRPGRLSVPHMADAKCRRPSCP